DDLVRVALRTLCVEEALAAGAARLVQDDERLIHEIVLLDDALQRARHLVGAAARARRHDEFNRLGRLPLGSRRTRHDKPGRNSQRDARHTSSLICIRHFSSLSRGLEPLVVRFIGAMQLRGTSGRVPTANVDYTAGKTMSNKKVSD